MSEVNLGTGKGTGTGTGTGTGFKELVLQALTKKENKVSNPVFMALIAVGLFIKISLGSIVSSNDGSVGPASAVLWGYFIVVFALIGIIFLNIDTGANEWKAIQALPLPLILCIIVLMWNISLNMKYFTEINERNVPDNYFTWSAYSTTLICAAIGISVVQYLLHSGTGQEGKDYSKQLSVYAYLFVFLSFVIISIQQVILDCFTVDG